MGANLPFGTLSGPRLLAAARADLARRGLPIARASSDWESPAWPPSDQPPFTNAVIEVYTLGRTAQETFALLLATEAAFGRERRERWGARTLDLDLLDSEGRVAEEVGLTLPHPRMHARAFVLAPLAEIAPEWRHPILLRTAADLLADTPPAQVVRRLPTS